jgi:hypothetical protein
LLHRIFRSFANWQERTWMRKRDASNAVAFTCTSFEFVSVCVAFLGRASKFACLAWFFASLLVFCATPDLSRCSFAFVECLCVKFLWI